MAGQRHRIRRYLFEVELDGIERAGPVQDTLTRVQRDHIEALLDTCLSERCPADQLLRIERLELNLGSLPIETLESALLQRMQSALRSAIATQQEQASRDAAHIGEDLEAETQLELIAFFLQTGTVPWWVDTSEKRPVATALHRLLSRKTPQVMAQLRSLLRDAGRCLRLIRHSEDGALLQLLSTLLLASPLQRSMRVTDVTRRVSYLLHSSAQELAARLGVSAAQLRIALWLGSLRAACSIADASPHEEDFWAEALAHAALDLAVPYGDLVSELVHPLLAADATPCFALQSVLAAAHVVSAPNAAQGALTHRDALARDIRGPVVSPNAAAISWGSKAPQAPAMGESELRHADAAESRLHAAGEFMGTLSRDTVMDSGRDAGRDSGRVSGAHSLADCGPQQTSECGQEAPSDPAVSTQPGALPRLANRQLGAPRTVDTPVDLDGSVRESGPGIATSEMDTKDTPKLAPRHPRHGQPATSPPHALPTGPRTDSPFDSDVVAALDANVTPDPELDPLAALSSELRQVCLESPHAVQKNLQDVLDSVAALGEPGTVDQQDATASVVEDERAAETRLSKHMRTGAHPTALRHLLRRLQWLRSHSFVRHAVLQRAIRHVQAALDPPHTLRRPPIHEPTRSDSAMVPPFADVQQRTRENVRQRSTVPLSFSETVETYVEYAGLVVLWPFLTPLFENLGLLHEQTFVDWAALHRATGLLVHLATGDSEPAEHQAALAKVLCGLPLSCVLDFADPLTDAEAAECSHVLLAAIAHARLGDDISPSEFRSAFVARRGVLSVRDDSWLLRVEHLGKHPEPRTLPWPISWIRLPWIDRPIYVEW